MPTDDEARRAARERLQARMDRRSQEERPSATRTSPRSPALSQSHPAAKRIGASQTRPTPTRRPSAGANPAAESGIQALLARFPNPVIPLAIAIIAFLLVFAVVVPYCTGPAGQTTSTQAQEPEQGSALESYRQPETGRVAIPDSGNGQQAELIALIGEEETVKLLSQARTSADALWISAHPDAYAPEGIEVQTKMLKLAADEPDAIAFVREYPDVYPLEEPSEDDTGALPAGSPESSVPDTAIPHFYQWDPRWGNTVYSSAAFGLTGCGPTSLAMVRAGLTGDASLTPYDLGVIARERNYMAQYDGTANTFFTDLAGELGMSCQEIGTDAGSITYALSTGQVLIANLGPGIFTQHGHFFVLAGLSDDGRVIVNDPYSIARSSQTWDPEVIAGESIAMYAYSTW